MKDNKTLYIATISDSVIRDAQMYHGKDSDLPWDDDDGWKDATINHFVGVYELSKSSPDTEERLRRKIAEQEDVLPDFVCLVPLDTCLRKAETQFATIARPTM